MSAASAGTATGGPRRARRPAGAALALSEAAFQAQVISYARLMRWHVMHQRNSVGTVAGWPDLFLVRDTRIVVAELKRETGRTTPAQDQWLSALTGAGLEVFVWKPSDWATILVTLR